MNPKNHKNLFCSDIGDVYEVNPFRDLRGEIPENVYGLMAHIASCYGATDTITSIAGISKYNEAAKQFSTYSFSVYNYLLEVMTSEKCTRARQVICMGKTSGNTLFDYEAVFVEDKSTNNPLIIILKKGINVTDYKCVPECELPSTAREKAYELTHQLEFQGLSLHPRGIHYNSAIDDFKMLLFDF